MLYMKMLCVLTYRWQQNNGSRMNKQTGPKHSEVLGETVCCVECAALQWLQTFTAPTPILYTVVPAQRAEHTRRHMYGAAVDHR